jgi:hypothetical protein
MTFFTSFFILLFHLGTCLIAPLLGARQKNRVRPGNKGEKVIGSGGRKGRAHSELNTIGIRGLNLKDMGRLPFTSLET